MRFSHNLNDFQGITDDLDRSPIADQIAGELRESDEPAVIGVYGSWGSGKSHLLSQAISHILDGNTTCSKKLIVCMFDAWKYELEGDLAIGLIKALGNIEQHAVGKNPRLSGEDYKKIAGLLLESISEIAEQFIPAGKLVSAVARIARKGLVTADALHADDAQKATHAQVDLIQDRMRELVTSILKAAKSTDPTANYRLAIFVDDLDRCSPENMVRMFEWLKVHLLVGECSYVMALDNIAAARAIVGQYKEYLGPDMDLGYGLRYLEKLFDSEYELDVAPGVERMALRTIYGSACRHRRVSALATSTDGVGADFPGVRGIDELLQLRAVCTPRTMMKIVAKYRRALSLLHSNDAEELRRRLPASYPFWLLYLITIYYRLEPHHLDDFVRGRGVLFELMRNPTSVGPEGWGTGPLYEFCSFSGGFAARSRESMQVPDPKILFSLAQVLRENTVGRATSD
jgi:hypothetical protein